MMNVLLFSCSHSYQEVHAGRHLDSAFVTFPQGSAEDWSIAEKINACMLCIIPLNPGRWMQKVTIVYCIIQSARAIVKD